MKYFPVTIAAMMVLAWGCSSTPVVQKNGDVLNKQFILHPVGKVVRKDGRTLLVIDKKYLDAMMGLEKFSHITVLYWFDRNDTPQKRAILQVHPGGNKNNPMRGVFATHSPVRPNLIAITRCKLLSVQGNTIEIDQIDAFDDSPVLDIKN